jgi:hypothetical protein
LCAVRRLGISGDLLLSENPKGMELMKELSIDGRIILTKSSGKN